MNIKNVYSAVNFELALFLETLYLGNYQGYEWKSNEYSVPHTCIK